MSNYKLYGENLIKDDSTFKKFAESLLNGIITKELKEEYEKFTNEKENNFEELLEELIESSLIDDISRTDINYEKLMQKYSNQIGEVLFVLENNGYDISTIGLTFFGNNCKQVFEFLMEGYIISSIKDNWFYDIIK